MKKFHRFEKKKEKKNTHCFYRNFQVECSLFITEKKKKKKEQMWKSIR